MLIIMFSLEIIAGWFSLKLSAISKFIIVFVIVFLVIYKKTKNIDEMNTLLSDKSTQNIIIKHPTIYIF